MSGLFRKLFNPSSNVLEIASLFLKIKGIKVTELTLHQQLEEHPNYPGVLSISDVYKFYGIDNIIVKFSGDKILQVPTPYITLIKGQKKSFNFYTVINKVYGDLVEYFDPENERWDTINASEFLARSLNIVLLSEFDESAGERRYLENVKIERRNKLTRSVALLFFPALCLIALIRGLFELEIFALIPSIFLVFTLAGCIITILLFLFEIDQFNPLLKRICSSGRNVNCGAILQSKAAKIFGISWSVIGGAYFFGILIYLLIFGIGSLETIAVVYSISILAFPYVFYSIYFQKFVIKQWCVLCLLVQLVLVIQFGLSIYVFRDIDLLVQSIYSHGYSLLVSLAIAFVILSILFPMIKRDKLSKYYKRKLQRLKHDKEIFEILLRKEDTISNSVDELGVFMGNPTAKYSLIKVCNPYCGPCSDAHKPMKELIENNDDLNIRIIYNVLDSNDLETILPARHFLAIEQYSGDKALSEALNTWYTAKNKSYELFSEKYPMSHSQLAAQDAKIENMMKWCDREQIDGTPTFFLSIRNNENRNSMYYKLPQMYTVEDLKYFFSV